MALFNLFGWSKKEETQVSAACGTACGAADEPRRETGSMRNSVRSSRRRRETGSVWNSMRRI